MRTFREAESPLSVRVGTALAVDAVTAEVVAALREEGVRSIVLRGPAVERWLYSERGERTYRDVDLLVAPGQSHTAEQVLGRLGFANRQSAYGPGEWADHSNEWSRTNPAVVIDLHRTLEGAVADSEETWDSLSEATEELDVAGVRVEVPTEPALALVVTLHAAQHGVRGTKQVRDLERALERATLATWSEAVGLAQRLDALPAFGAGLCLVSRGAQLAERLEVPRIVDPERALRASSASSTSIGFARLVAARGASARGAIIARKLFPSRAFMRHWSPLARTGSAGLALSYLWRPLWLALRTGPAALAWLRARRP